jgi:uncharacterized protein with HEPN domain
MNNTVDKKDVPEFKYQSTQSKEEIFSFLTSFDFKKFSKNSDLLQNIFNDLESIIIK